MSARRHHAALLARLLVATPALALMAALSSLQSAGAQTASDRALPARISITTTPLRERFRPYTFTTTGRVVPPLRYCAPGANPGPGTANCVRIFCPPDSTDPRTCSFPAADVICGGTVNVRFQKRSTTISSRNVFVRSDCTYRSRVNISLLLPPRRGRLRVRARFQGNAVLAPRSSATRTVRAG